ncbi:MAG: hypothetical protein ACOCUI_00890 [bacterium]
MRKERIGDVVWVYNSKNHSYLTEKLFDNIHCYEKAIIRNIRCNVKTSIGNWIYPILYDVQFLNDGKYSRGHFEIIPIY